MNNTYVRGIRANVWEYALRKVPYDTGIRAALKADVDAYHAHYTRPMGLRVTRDYLVIRGKRRAR